MRRFIFAVILIQLAACGNTGGTKNAIDSGKTAKNQISNKTESKGEPVPKNTNLTAFAHFIAGMKDSNAMPATRKNMWLNFANNTNEKWKVLTDRIGAKIENWVKENPQEIKNEPATLFYPFAGGDFYYANLFFPKQDTVIMIGLEPGGSIFDPSKVSDTTMLRYYGNLDHTMFFPHRLGFFRTKSMANDFNRGPLNGTLHTVLFYIARAGYNIHYITHFNLDKDGNETEIVSAADMNKKTKRIAYKVGYALPNSNIVKEVIYISYDASDGYLKEHTGLMNWLGKRNKMVTFFKAASYLMHETYFNIVRNFVKTHTVRLLQDDSGLPYQFMLDNGFKVTLLGEYTRTIKLFAGRFQPKMKKEYAAQKPAKLPFLIGYNAEFKECNMQSAVKQ
jgi:hypothetical protein